MATLVDLPAVETWLRGVGVAVERVGSRRLLVASPLDGHEAALTLAWRADVVQVTQAIVLVERPAYARAAVALCAGGGERVD